MLAGIGMAVDNRVLYEQRYLYEQMEREVKRRVEVEVNQIKQYYGRQSDGWASDRDPNTYMEKPPEKKNKLLLLT